MKVIITKDTPKDIIIYLKDISNGLIKEYRKTSTKTQVKTKIAACLMAINILLTGYFAMTKRDSKADTTPLEVEIPMEELDIDLKTDVGPVLSYYDNPVVEVQIPTASLSKESIEAPTTIESAIKLYTDIFEVKTDIVGPLVLDKINNSPDFYTENTIDNVRYPNMHEAIFFTVLDIVYNPGKYGYNNEELKSNIDFETDLSAEELTFIFSEYFDINPFFAQAIEYTECGSKMNSYDYLFNNNPAGIGPHNKFRNKATGVIYLCYLLSDKYNITIDSGIEDLDRISSYYCTSGTENWKRLTNEFYTELTTEGILSKADNNENYVIDNMTYQDYLRSKNIVTR